MLLTAGLARPAPPRRRLPPTRAKKQSLVEQMLDVMEGGPKLRKWYGAAPLGEAEAREETREREPEPEPEVEEEAGDAVLVSEGETPLAEAVITALVLAGRSVKLLSRTPALAAAARTSFGDYVRPCVVSDARDSAAVRKALSGCSCLVVCGPLGALAEQAARVSLAHVLLLSRSGAAAPLGGLLLPPGERARGEAGREEALRAAFSAERRFTILRLGSEVDAPGGREALLLSASTGEVGAGGVSREDAAAVVASILDGPPRGLSLELAAGERGRGGVSALLPDARQAWRGVIDTL